MKKDKIKPSYVARKSLWPAFKIWRLLLIAVFAVGFLFVEPIQTALSAYVELDATIIMIALGVLTAIPVLVIIIHMIILAHIKIEFYDSCIIVKKGVFNRKQKSALFMGVLTADTEKTFWGDIFNYGNVVIKTLGKLNVDTTKIAKPTALQEYLKTRYVNQPAVHVLLPMK